METLLDAIIDEASDHYLESWVPHIEHFPEVASVLAELQRRGIRTGLLSNRAANAALQIHGGYGFMDEYAISRLYRDQKILEIGEGTNEVQRLVIARSLQ